MLRQSSSNAGLNLAQRFHEAYAAHARGALAQAEGLYKVILKDDPKHFDVLHLLGFLNYQRGCLAEALEFLGLAFR